MTDNQIDNIAYIALLISMSVIGVTMAYLAAQRVVNFFDKPRGKK